MFNGFPPLQMAFKDEGDIVGMHPAVPDVMGNNPDIGARAA